MTCEQIAWTTVPFRHMVTGAALWQTGDGISEAHVMRRKPWPVLAPFLAGYGRAKPLAPEHVSDAKPGPTLVVETNYPGANAKVVADTIAPPIEEQFNGVENLLYMISRSTNDGRYSPCHSRS